MSCPNSENLELGITLVNVIKWILSFLYFTVKKCTFKNMLKEFNLDMLISIKFMINILTITNQVCTILLNLNLLVLKISSIYSITRTKMWFCLLLEESPENLPKVKI